MTTRKNSNDFENRYFSLLQDSIERVETKVEANTKLTEATHQQASLTNSRVDKLEKEVFGKVKPSDLPPWWKDPKTLFNVSLFLVLIASIVAQLLGIDIRKIGP